MAATWPSWPLPVNRTVDDIQVERPIVISGSTVDRRPIWPALIAMLLYPTLRAGSAGRVDSVPVMMALSALTYFLGIYLLYAIAGLAYRRHTYLLWAGFVGGILIGYLVSGIENLWLLMTGASLVFMAAVVIGRLTLAGRNQMTVYVIGLMVVAILSLAEFVPRWPDLMKLADEYRATLLRDFQANLAAGGYSGDVAQGYSDMFSKVMSVTTRLLPASLVAGAMAQYTVGYLWFTGRELRTPTGIRLLTPFSLWKVPFAVTPAVIVAIIARLLGGESVTLIADNVLAVLALFYCVTGLALVEYYQKKLGLSWVMRTFFYLLLFIAQLAGLVVIVLLGFVDSFADWRKVDTPRISLENQ